MRSKNHFMRINLQEVPMLPPFEANQSLANDKVLEIFQYAIPNSWNKEMRRQGFDPLKQSLKEFIDFCERQEESEGFEDKASPSKKKKDTTRHKSDNRGSTDKSNNGYQKAKHSYCKNHGPNNTHNTKDCRTKDGQTSNYNSNKTWKRSDYSKSNSDSILKLQQHDCAELMWFELHNGGSLMCSVRTGA